MLSLSTLVLSALALASSVSAHGYVRKLAVDGTFYAGNSPNVDVVFPSPIRRVADIVPVKGAANPAVNCGWNATAAALVAPANPGSMVAFDWASGEDGNWPHNIGPMLTYMASCGNATCDRFDSAQAEWFKIDEVGKKPDNATWFQQDIQQGLTHTVGLPSSIAPGDYLIRHEIIALHLATDLGGAEFYPSCAQLRISGNGTSTPPSNSLVALPCAYSDTDPGILVPTVFDAGANYTAFPGPAPAPGLAARSSAITAPSNSTAGGRKPSTSVARGASVTSTSVGAATTATAANAQSCTLAAKRALPRRISRIMRGDALVDFAA